MRRNYITFVEKCNIYIYISYRLSPWHLFLTKGFCFFKKKQRQNNSWNKHIVLAEIQYVNECFTSLMELSLTIIFLYNFCFKGKIPPLRNYVFFFFLLFHSCGRAYCIHAVMLLLLMIIDTYTSISGKKPKEHVFA